jgi:hypothetical protein
MPPTITLEQATGFGVFMTKAVLSGRGDEMVDLAKLIFFGRREGLSALAIRLLLSNPNASLNAICPRF